MPGPGVPGPGAIRFAVSGIEVTLEVADGDVILRSAVDHRVLGRRDPAVIQALIERAHPGVAAMLAERAGSRVEPAAIAAIALCLVTRTVQARSWAATSDEALAMSTDFESLVDEDEIVYRTVLRLGIADVRGAMSALLGWTSERFDDYQDHLAFLEWK